MRRQKRETSQRRTRRHHAHSGISLLFNLSDMASIGPLTMARDNVIRVQTSQTLLVVDFRDIGELWYFQITCIREMGLTNGGQVTLSGNVKLRIVTTILGILEGNICAAVCTYEKGARVFGIGWGCRLC